MSDYDTVKYRIDGVWYRWSGWLGCQLKSVEWRRVQVGDMRRILGRDMAVFSVSRKWFRYEIAWAIGLPKGPGTLDKQNELINALQADLRALT